MSPCTAAVAWTGPSVCSFQRSLPVRLSRAYRCVSYEPISTRSPASVGDDFTSPPVLNVHRRLPSADADRVHGARRDLRRTPAPADGRRRFADHPAGRVLPAQLSRGEIDRRPDRRSTTRRRRIRRRSRATRRSLRRRRSVQRSAGAAGGALAAMPVSRDIASELGPVIDRRLRTGRRHRGSPPRAPQWAARMQPRCARRHGSSGHVSARPPPTASANN